MCHLSKVKKQTSYLPSGERSCFSAKHIWATRMRHIEKMAWNFRLNKRMNRLVGRKIHFSSSCPLWLHMAPSSWRHGPLDNEETRLLLQLLQRASNHQLFLDKCHWALCPLQKGRDVWKFPMPWHRGKFLRQRVSKSQLYRQFFEIQPVNWAIMELFCHDQAALSHTHSTILPSIL